MAKSAALSIDDAFNAVALEERLDLISRANGEGILAGIGCLFLLGSAAYGFDQIWILGASAIASLFVVPLFTSYAWRRNRPKLILEYLAVRSVGRRYAYACNIADLDIVLIFRGTMRETFSSAEDQMMIQSAQTVDLENSVGGDRPVWIVLLRGGLVLMSERSGGAKLEFCTPLGPEVTCKKPAADEDAPERALAITGIGMSRGRRVLLWSDYPGALYVFEKQMQRLAQESLDSRRQLLDMIGTSAEE